MPRIKPTMLFFKNAKSYDPQAKGGNKPPDMRLNVRHPPYPESSMDLLPFRCVNKSSEAPESGLGRLPLEIVEDILDYLEVSDLDAARFVSPSWWGLIMMNSRALKNAITYESVIWDQSPDTSDCETHSTGPADEELQHMAIRLLGRTFDGLLSGLCTSHVENNWKIRYQNIGIRLTSLGNQRLECVRVSLSGRLVAGIVTEGKSQTLVVYILRTSRELVHLVSVPCPLPGVRPCTLHIVEASNFSNYWAVDLLYPNREDGLDPLKYHFQAVYKDACGPKQTLPEWIPGPFYAEFSTKKGPLFSRETSNDWTLLEKVPLPEHGKCNYWLAQHRPTNNLFVIRHSPQIVGVNNPEITLIKLLSRPAHESEYTNLAIAPEVDFLHESGVRTIHIAILWSTPSSPRSTLFTYSLRFMRSVVLCKQSCDMSDHELALPSWWEVDLEGRYAGPQEINYEDPQTRGVWQRELIGRLWREGPVQGKRVCSFPQGFGGMHGSMLPPNQQQGPSQAMVSAGMRVIGEGHWRVLLWGAPDEEDGVQTLQKMRLLDFELGRLKNCKRPFRHNGWLSGMTSTCACELHDYQCDVVLPRGNGGELSTTPRKQELQAKHASTGFSKLFRARLSMFVGSKGR
ncbi:MAG: hypothetical protein M1814_005122 [Vezdaea aestivalis]|nr:MAG: hypothetical protein M1814_005122 [Vezdaea aestivalis]